VISRLAQDKRGLNDATNTGTNSKLVGCSASAGATGGGALALTAHGDLYSGADVIGTSRPLIEHRKPALICCFPNPPTTGWSSTDPNVAASSDLKFRALPSACAPSDCYTPACNSNGGCQYKRVGSAVSSTAVYGTASIEVRMKPCSDSTGKPITGAVSTLWLYNYTERYCDTSNPCKVIGHHRPTWQRSSLPPLLPTQLTLSPPSHHVCVCVCGDCRVRWC